MRILIVRLSALGDVIHGLPVACALRNALPSATIGWVVEGRAGDLLEGHPAVDLLYRVPRGWLKSLGTVRSIRQQLRADRFDVTVDLQCLTKSSIMAWLSGARRRLGAGGKDGRELSKWLNNDLTKVRAAHVVEHYLGLLDPLEIGRPEVHFDLHERDEDERFARQALADLQLSEDRFVILNPGAGWESKIWPAERYGAVARYLHARHGIPSLVVWGGDAEKPLAETIVRDGGDAVRLAPATDLRQLAAVLRRGRLFLGSDTGPMHLAVAVETPTISLHGTSRSEWCGAYGDANIRLQAYYDDGSARQRRRTDNRAMQAITVEMACDACETMLSRTPERKCG